MRTPVGDGSRRYPKLGQALLLSPPDASPGWLPNASWLAHSLTLWLRGFSSRSAAVSPWPGFCSPSLSLVPTKPQGEVDKRPRLAHQTWRGTATEATHAQKAGSPETHREGIRHPVSRGGCRRPGHLQDLFFSGLNGDLVRSAAIAGLPRPWGRSCSSRSSMSPGASSGLGPDDVASPQAARATHPKLRNLDDPRSARAPQPIDHSPQERTLAAAREALLCGSSLKIFRKYPDSAVSCETMGSWLPWQGQRRKGSVVTSPFVPGGTSRR